MSLVKIMKKNLASKKLVKMQQEEQYSELDKTDRAIASCVHHTIRVDCLVAHSHVPLVDVLMLHLAGIPWKRYCVESYMEHCGFRHYL